MSEAEILRRLVLAQIRAETQNTQDYKLAKNVVLRECASVAEMKHAITVIEDYLGIKRSIIQ